MIAFIKAEVFRLIILPQFTYLSLFWRSPNWFAVLENPCGTPLSARRDVTFNVLILFPRRLAPRLPHRSHLPNRKHLCCSGFLLIPQLPATTQSSPAPGILHINHFQAASVALQAAFFCSFKFLQIYHKSVLSKLLSRQGRTSYCPS